MSVIRLQKVGRRYEMGSEVIHALKEVTLEIGHAEYVAFMGPSGSGKSTLMNVIGCLDTPTSGTYELNGVNVSDMDDNDLAEVRNREIGFVFQTFNLLPRATALRNVELPLVYGGVGAEDRREQAMETNPSIILADEPTGNLDSRTGDEIMTLFDELYRQGNTIILVTHEESVARHARRIVRILDGQIAGDETVNREQVQVAGH
jgi:putative ABC transport system ATP-binding protein